MIAARPVALGGIANLRRTDALLLAEALLADGGRGAAPEPRRFEWSRPGASKQWRGVSIRQAVPTQWGAIRRTASACSSLSEKLTNAPQLSQKIRTSVPVTRSASSGSWRRQAGQARASKIRDGGSAGSKFAMLTISGNRPPSAVASVEPDRTTISLPDR